MDAKTVEFLCLEWLWDVRWTSARYFNAKTNLSFERESVNSKSKFVYKKV